MLFGIKGIENGLAGPSSRLFKTPRPLCSRNGLGRAEHGPGRAGQAFWDARSMPGESFAYAWGTKGGLL